MRGRDPSRRRWRQALLDRVRRRDDRPAADRRRHDEPRVRQPTSWADATTSRSSGDDNLFRRGARLCRAVRRHLLRRARAVPQYSLYERRRLHLWQDIKDQIKDLEGPSTGRASTPSPVRFRSSADVGAAVPPDRRLPDHRTRTSSGTSRGSPSAGRCRCPPHPQGRDGARRQIDDASTTGSRRRSSSTPAATHTYTRIPDNPQKAADPGCSNVPAPTRAS